jgi:hypothetical protein
VEVCVPPGGYRDRWSGLHLAGGKHLLTYDQALAYVRTRHGVTAEGDAGGDLPRKPPPAPSGGKPGHGKRHNAAGSGGGGYGSATFVQSRNAGASICSGLPAAVNSGSPP